MSRIVPQSETWSGTEGSPIAPSSTASWLAQGLERILRHHPAVLVEVRGAPRKLGPVEREAERVDGLPRLGDHLRADPVAGKQGDPVRHAGAATAGETLST